MKTLFINAKIWTGKNSFAESIGFDSEKGKIIFTGTKADANNLSNECDVIFDL